MGISRTYASEEAATEAVLNAARSQLGYTEGPNNNSKYGQWYGMNYEPWCDMFKSWCFDQAGLLGMPFTLKSAWVPGTAMAYENAGARTHSPQPGDVLCIWGTPGTLVHVGIIESVVSESTVIFISGNTADPNGTGSKPRGNEQEGWGVFRRYHVLQYEDVIGRPDWSKAVSSHPTPVTPTPVDPTPATPKKGPDMLLINVGDAVYAWVPGHCQRLTNQEFHAMLDLGVPHEKSNKLSQMVKMTAGFEK